jgi:hypothetical protein
MALLLIILLSVSGVEGGVWRKHGDIYLNLDIETVRPAILKTTIPPTTEIVNITYSTTALPQTTTERAATTEVFDSTTGRSSVIRGLYLDDDLLLGTLGAKGLTSAPPTRGTDSTFPNEERTTSAPETTLAPVAVGDADLALKKAETPEEGYWAWIPDSWQDALKGGCNQGS